MGRKFKLICIILRYFIDTWYTHIIFMWDLMEGHWWCLSAALRYSQFSSFSSESYSNSVKKINDCINLSFITAHIVEDY